MKTDDVYFDGKHYYKMNLHEVKRDDGSVGFSVERELLDVKKMYLPICAADGMRLATMILDGVIEDLRKEQKYLRDVGNLTWLSEVREAMAEDIKVSLEQAEGMLRTNNDIEEIYGIMRRGSFLNIGSDEIAASHSPVNETVNRIRPFKELAKVFKRSLKERTEEKK